jgi:hypothetical protein
LVFLTMVVLPGDRRFTVVRAASQGTDDGVQLLELAVRLLAQRGGSTQVVDRLLPGRLADELPFDLPIPPNGRLLGSLVRSSDLNGTSVEVVMDAPGLPDQVLAIFDEAMPPQGWGPPPPGTPGMFAPGSPPGGGFQPPDQVTRLVPRSSTYCREPNGAFLTVTANPRESGPNDLRAMLQFPPTSLTGSGYGACAILQPVPPPGPGTIAPGPDLLPRLTLPEGVSLDQGAGRGSGATGLGSYGTGATVITEMSVTSLEAYFAEQLGALGWTRQAGSAGDLVAWSIWRLPRQDVWQGTLVVLRRPGEERRTLMVRVDSLADAASSRLGMRSTGAQSLTLPREPVPDPRLLRELAERLLMDPLSSRTANVPPPTLLVGQLSPDWELDLPLPEGTRLVGSLVRAPGDTSQPPGQIVLDVPGVPRDVRAFFNDALVNRGWTPPPYTTPSGPSGFISAGTPLAASFCQEDNGSRLTFSIRGQASGVSDVQVMRESGATPCWSPITDSRFGSPPNVLIPPLIADPEAELYPGTMQIGPLTFESNAMVVADATTEQLEASFRQQLEDAGWTELAAQASGALAWSMWAVPGEGTWHGLLLAFDLPGDHRHALLLRIDQASEGPSARGE